MSAPWSPTWGRAGALFSTTISIGVWGLKPGRTPVAAQHPDRGRAHRRREGELQVAARPDPYRAGHGLAVQAGRGRDPRLRREPAPPWLGSGAGHRHGVVLRGLPAADRGDDEAAG